MTFPETNHENPWKSCWLQHDPFPFVSGFCLFAGANLLLNFREGIHKWPLFWLEFRPCFGGLTFKNRVKSQQNLPDSWFWLVKLGKNCFDWLLTSTPPPPKNHRESPYVGHASQLGSKSLTLWSLGLTAGFRDWWNVRCYKCGVYVFGAQKWWVFNVRMSWFSCLGPLCNSVQWFMW